MPIGQGSYFTSLSLNCCELHWISSFALFIIIKKVPFYEIRTLYLATVKIYWQKFYNTGSIKRNGAVKCLERIAFLEKMFHTKWPSEPEIAQTFLERESILNNDLG